MLKGKITSILVDDDNDVTFYFDDSAEGFATQEFEVGSLTRKALGIIEYEIQDYNSEVDLIREGG